MYYKLETKATLDALNYAFPDFKFGVSQQAISEQRRNHPKIKVWITSGPLDFSDPQLPVFVDLDIVYQRFHFAPNMVLFLQSVIKVIKFGTKNQWFEYWEYDKWRDEEHYTAAFDIDIQLGRCNQPYRFRNVRKLKGTTNYMQVAGETIAWTRLGAVATP